METLTPASTRRHARIRLTTEPSDRVHRPDRPPRAARRRRGRPLRHPQCPDASYDDGHRRQRARAAAAGRLPGLLEARCARRRRLPARRYDRAHRERDRRRAPQRSCPLPRPAAAILGLPQRGERPAACSAAGSACSWWSWTARASGRFRCSSSGRPGDEGQDDSARADRGDEPLLASHQILAVPAARPCHAGRVSRR